MEEYTENQKIQIYSLVREIEQARNVQIIEKSVEIDDLKNDLKISTIINYSMWILVAVSFWMGWMIGGGR